MQNYLWLVQLGANVPGRLTEQHDVYLDIAPDLLSLKNALRSFWPGCTSLHVDGYERVEYVGGHKISVVEAGQGNTDGLNLFFVNLGGYRPDSAVEFHHQLLIVAETMKEAITQAKGSDFYQTMRVAGGPSHVDNRYGVAVDEIFNVKDILPAFTRSQFDLNIEPISTEKGGQNQRAAGYFKLNELGKTDLNL